MGSSLIVHIVKGPRKLVPTEEAKRLVTEAIHAANEYIDNYVDGARAESYEDDLRATVTEVLDPNGSDVEDVDEAAYAVQRMGPLWLEEFCAAWPDVGYRDSEYRVYGDEVVVVAGDRSDSPEGTGYERLTQLFFVKGLAEALSIR